MNRIKLWIKSFGKCYHCRRFTSTKNPIVGVDQVGHKICFECFWKRLTPADQDDLRAKFSE